MKSQDSLSKTLNQAKPNDTANFYEGLIEQYNQQNFVPIQNLYFWNVNFYAIDDWKVLPKLSLQFGARFEHLGPWNGKHGIGIAVFDPSTVNNAASRVPGFTWHGLNSAIPTSGVPSRLAFIEPRVGLSYDFYGNGKTVARGGWGMYRNQDNYNVVAAGSGAGGRRPGCGSQRRRGWAAKQSAEHSRKQRRQCGRGQLSERSLGQRIRPARG